MRRAYIFLTVLPFLAACASNAPVRTPVTTLPSAFESRVAAGVAPLSHWWTAYNDPQLQSLIDEALIKAPTAEIATARLEEARATRLANIRSAYPTGVLNANVSARSSNQLSGAQSAFQSNGVSTSEAANFDVSWEADIWGKTKTTRRAVDIDYAGKVFNIEASRAALAANVADSLFAARGLAQQLEDARESARIARQGQTVAGVRASRGLVPQADADRTAADVAQADAAVVGLTADLSAARRSLLVLTGRGTEPLSSLIISPTVGDPPLPPAAVPGELLQRRPDVREAEQRLAVAIAQLKVDRVNLFPKLTIMPGVGLARSTSDSFTGFSSTGAPTFGKVSSVVANWSIGAGLSVPVLNRPYLLATARASGARAEQAVIAYDSAVQTAYGEAENALVELQSDRDRLALLTAGERSARVAYDGAKTRYEAGLDDLTSLLSAEQAWRGARSQASAARAQAMRRSVQTFKALGGGWTPGDDFKG